MAFSLKHITIGRKNIIFLITRLDFFLVIFPKKIDPMGGKFCLFLSNA